MRLIVDKNFIAHTICFPTITIASCISWKALKTVACLVSSHLKMYVNNARSSPESI